MRLLFAVSLACLLIGCTSSPSPVLPPVKLTPIKNKTPTRTLWTANLGEGVGYNYLKLRPVFDDDTGYAVDYKGHIRAFALTDGHIKWERDIKLAIAGGLTLEASMLLMGTSQGKVIALHPSDGHELWRSEVSSEVLSLPRSAHGVVVVRTVDGRLYGLDASNGQRHWVYDRSVPLLTLRGNSSPLIVNDMVITGADSGKLTALTLKDGIVLWETAIAVSHGRTELERVIDIDADPVVVDDVVYVVTYQGRLAAVRLDSGRILWARDISSYSGLVVDAYRVYVTDAEGQIWSLNRFNGSTLWRQDKLLRRALTAPVLTGNHLAIGDFDGYIHWLTREDGRLVARARVNEAYYLFREEEDNDLLFSKSNNVLIAPVVVQNMIIAMDRLGHMSAFKLATP